MTLNNQNNIKTEFSSQNFTDMGYYTSHNLFHLLKNNFICHLTFKLTLDLENDLESSKKYQKRMLKSKSHKNDVSHLFLFAFAKIHFFVILIFKLTFWPWKLPWKWPWIIIIISEIDYQVKITLKRGITLITSFICRKVVFSLIWPSIMVAILKKPSGDNVYTQRMLEWESMNFYFYVNKCFITNNAGFGQNLGLCYRTIMG